MRTRETMSDVLGRNKMKEDLRSELMGQTAALARASGRIEKARHQIKMLMDVMRDATRNDLDELAAEALATLTAPDEEWDKAMTQCTTELLNELLIVDKPAIQSLFQLEVYITHDGLANHPVCPVSHERTISCIGMINTLLHVFTEGRGTIATCWNTDASGASTDLIKFDVFKNNSKG